MTPGGAGNPRIRDWRGVHVWLVGASSGIGAALAPMLAERGATLALSARRADALESLAGKLPGGAECLPLDVTEAESVQAAAQALLNRWPRIDLVIWLAGTYEPMRAQSFDLARARRTVEANVMGPMHCLAALSAALDQGRCKGLAFVSSVAGYRGLPRSLAYGPTKAALTNFAEALFLDLHPSGIGVWVINPGFVDTPLTAKNDFRMPALLPPEAAAEAIVDGLGSGRFEIHFPKRFTRMMKLLRSLPYALYFAAVRRATGA